MKDYNNNNIVTGLKVEFKRNMKVYIKVLYIFMTENMIKNIKLEGNTQYISDTTYYCIQPQYKTLKIWILLAYNKNINKTMICNISLIKNENFETLKCILIHLKGNYNLIPNLMIIDFNKTAYKVFKFLIKEIILVIYFFHLFQNLLLHLPEYKEKNNKIIKKNEKNIILNMKVLCFKDKIDKCKY